MKAAIAIALGLSFLASPHGTKAQDLASLLGTVSDSSGAVVGGAKVTVSNIDGGFTREVTSDGNGSYSVARVPIGSFTITAESDAEFLLMEVPMI